MNAPARTPTPTSLALLAALLVTMGGLPPAARAQETPADTAAVLVEAARELVAAADEASATGLLRHVLERYPGTPAASAARRLLASFARAESEGMGRTQLVVSGTLYGLWLGAALPAAVGADGPEPYGAGLLLGGPGGFFLSRAYAGSHPVTAGEARTMTFGALWGTWQGLGWQEVFDFGVETGLACPGSDPPEGGCIPFEESRTEETFAAMVVGGLAGLTAASLVARGAGVSDGTSTATSLGALWGTWYGFAGGTIADADDEALWSWMLLGGNAGLAAGALLGSRAGVNRSRARAVSIAGVAGMVAGWGLDLLLDVNDTPEVIYLPAAGSVLGLAAGSVLFRDDDGGGGEGAAGGAGWTGARLRPAAIPVATARGEGVAPGIRLTLPAPRF